MNTNADLEKCFTFINCQLHPADHPTLGDHGRRFNAVTISRQAGAGGYELAQRLAEQLQAQQLVGGRPWTVFDRNLVAKVLEDHNLPSRLARFMPEDHVSEIADIMDELFGLHPPSWVLARQTSETILRLVKLGNVIVLGRGANVVTSRLPHVLHVRLVGSLMKRVERLQEFAKLTREAALKLAEKEDLARQRYLKQFFDKDINDPLLYHLIINTDLNSTEEAARMIAMECGMRSLNEPHEPVGKAGMMASHAQRA